MPSNHLILCHPLLLLPSIFPSISLLQWVSSSHQVAKLLEFQIQHQSFHWIFRTDFLYDWLVWSPCSPRDSQESSPTPQFKNINSLVLSQLLHPFMTTGKTTALIRQNFVGKVISLPFNMLSRLVITFLPRSKHLLISWLQVTICSDFGTPKNKVCHCFHSFPNYLSWSDGTRCYDLSFLNVEFETNFFTLLFHFL